MASVLQLFILASASQIHIKFWKLNSNLNIIIYMCVCVRVCMWIRSTLFISKSLYLRYNDIPVHLHVFIAALFKMWRKTALHILNCTPIKELLIHIEKLHFPFFFVVFLCSHSASCFPPAQWGAGKQDTHGQFEQRDIWMWTERKTGHVPITNACVIAEAKA